MVATRTGQHSGQQQALSDMPGVDVKRKTGGGKQANERPQDERPLKRTKAGGRSGKKAAAAAEARESHAHDQEQETAANDARAVVAAVDTGEDPQKKLQKDTKQAGLKAEGGGGGGGKPHDSKTGDSGDGANPQDSKAEGGATKDVHMDKSDHGNAKPAGAQRSGASGKGSETRAAKVADPRPVTAAHPDLMTNVAVELCAVPA
jgi:hypothetical protein